MTLFISLFLAYIIATNGFIAAVICAIAIRVLVSIHESITAIEEYELVFPTVERYSDEIIGTYDGKHIHDYIVIKNQDDNCSYRYLYIDIIQIDYAGNRRISLESTDVLLESGMVYRNTGFQESTFTK
jgi:hypothetical protein